MSKLTAFVRRLRSNRTQPGSEKGLAQRVHNQFFADRASGVMVEVGAADPTYLSQGALYRKKGWRVLSVEPNPAFAARHRELGNEIVEAAASDRNADDQDFFVVDSNRAEYEGGEISYESFSSLGIEGQFAKELGELGRTSRKIKVAVRTLDTILADRKVTTVDLLAIDVEGWELSVMRGLSRNPPVVILENYTDNDAYRAYMRQRGYDLWLQLAPNEVYVLRSGGKSTPKAEYA